MVGDTVCTVEQCTLARVDILSVEGLVAVAVVVVVVVTGRIAGRHKGGATVRRRRHVTEEAVLLRAGSGAAADGFVFRQADRLQRVKGWNSVI